MTCVTCVITVSRLQDFFIQSESYSPLEVWLKTAKIKLNSLQISTIVCIFTQLNELIFPIAIASQGVSALIYIFPLINKKLMALNHITPNT